MDFGYFTLSDNRYPGNTRSAEQLIAEIYEQALWAETVGLNSAWIGEHHFNLLGVNACPNILLAKIAGATTRIRLAPAVVLLPVHHPLHVAEEWATLDLLSGGRVDFAAGRGYDKKEYGPFQAPFDKSAELAAANDWNIIYAPFAAAMVYGSLGDAVRIYREECEVRHNRPPRRSMCSYFIHIADTPAEEAYGRAALIRYFHDALIAAFPSDAKTVPPTYAYFVKIVEILRDMKPENLTAKSVLVGSPQKIIDDLKSVEATGISEVILYFNYGLKPHGMVKEQMQRFMTDIAPAFDGAHKRIAAHSRGTSSPLAGE